MVSVEKTVSGTAGYPPLVLMSLGVAILYTFSALLGLELAVVHGHVTAVWPPSGIAIAALLLLGTRVWPAITAAALLVNFWSGLPLLTAMLIATGNTLAGVVGARLVCHFSGARTPLDNCQGLVALVVAGGIIATLLSATVGVAALAMTGMVSIDSTPALWTTWWLGDAAGVTVFAPLLLAWGAKPFVHWNRLRVVEGLTLAISLMFTAQLVFSGWFHLGAENYPLAFLVIPILIWAAVRFGRRGAALAITIVSLHAIWGTVHGFGPFLHHDLNESLLMLQAYMSVCSITVLMLAIVLRERRIAQQRLEQNQAEMEQRIVERTRDLSAANIHLLTEMRRHKQSQGMVSSLGQILEESLNEIYIFDAHTLQFLNINQGARNNLGYSLVELRKMTPVDIKPEMTQEMFDRNLAPLRDGSLEHLCFETMHCRKDGSQYPVEVHLQLSSLGARQAFVAIIIDISERREAGNMLRQAKTVFDNSNEGVMVTDADWNITGVNRALTEIIGHAEADLLGKPASILKSDRHDAAFFENINTILLDKGCWQGEIWQRRESGEAYPQWASISVVRNEAGLITNYVHVFTDIAAIEGIQEHVKYLAYHDPLTGLPNRALFNDRLTHALHHTRRSGKRVAMLFLDLDGFKDINDSLGHLLGDELLQQVAGRLVTTVREMDTVSRYGGDEFTIILEEIEELGNVVSISERILYELRKPFEIGGTEKLISTSIGISVFPEDGRNEYSLIERADMAMYQAKREGGNRFSFWHRSEMSVRAEDMPRDREFNQLVG